MNLTELQQLVEQFVCQNKLHTPVEFRLLDIASELGDVCKEALKSSAYGQQPFCATPPWSAEIGDLLFSVICLANVNNIDLDQALSQAMEKYRQRLANAGTASSGA